MAPAALESGVYFIQNLGTGTVVDIGDRSTADCTKIQGYTKRELSDKLVPAQLWIISKVGTDPVYTIQSAVNFTFLTLNGSNATAACSCCQPTDPANQAPIERCQDNDTDNQKWVITRANNGVAYVIRNKATGTYVDLSKGCSDDGTTINGWCGEGVGTANTHQLWLIVRA